MLPRIKSTMSEMEQALAARDLERCKTSPSSPVASDKTMV